MTASILLLLYVLESALFALHCPVSLHKEQGQFIINEKEELCKLEISNTKITIHYYYIYGDLKRSVNCKTGNFEQSFGGVQSIQQRSTGKVIFTLTGISNLLRFPRKVQQKHFHLAL